MMCDENMIICAWENTNVCYLRIYASWYDNVKLWLRSMSLDILQESRDIVVMTLYCLQLNCDSEGHIIVFKVLSFIVSFLLKV